MKSNKPKTHSNNPDSSNNKDPNVLTKLVYYSLWILLHLIVGLIYESFQFVYNGWKIISRKLWSCWPRSDISTLAPCILIGNEVKGYKKIPKHIGFLLIPEETSILKKLQLLISSNWSSNDQIQTVADNEGKDVSLDLQGLAKLILWSHGANIPIISVYDYKGQLKERQTELAFILEDEFIQNAWTMKKVPIIKFHNVPRNDENFNGIKLTKSDNSLHIIILSREDGKPNIIETTKDLSRIPSIVSSPLTESNLDTYLHLSQKWSQGVENGPVEPDVLVISGNIHSTLGFLPWHIRLTEIHWIPKLPFVEVHDFVKVLRSYAGCQQRFGN